MESWVRQHLVTIGNAVNAVNVAVTKLEASGI